MVNQSAVSRIEVMQEKDSVKIESPEEVQTIDLCSDDSDSEEEFCFGDRYLCLNETTNTLDEVDEKHIVKNNYKKARSNSAVEPSFDINKFKFKCVICKKIFRNDNLLKTHMMTHIIMIQKEHAYCKQVLLYEDHLTKCAKMKHSGVRYRKKSKQKKLGAQSKVNKKNPKSEEKNRDNIKNICTICKRTFYRSSHLQRHMKTHNTKRDKEFLCQYCDSRYYHKYNLGRHIQDKHLKRRFYCKFCCYSSPKKYKCTYHILSKHTNRTNKGKIFCKA